MDRPIRYKTIHMKCDRCECELLDGETCYNHYDTIYCSSCWETYLEELTADCEMEAEDEEVLS